MESQKFFVFNSFPSHKKHRFVDFDDLKIGRDIEILGTNGVSCCLVITLYDPSRNKGVLTHITNFDDSPEELRPKNVVDTLLNALGLTPKSDNLASLEATLAGEHDKFDKTDHSSTTVKQILKTYGIPIIGEDLGDIPKNVKSLIPGLSVGGRLVFLHCETGIVEVYRA